MREVWRPNQEARLPARPPTLNGDLSERSSAVTLSLMAEWLEESLAPLPCSQNGDEWNGTVQSDNAQRL